MSDDRRNQLDGLRPVRRPVWPHRAGENAEGEQGTKRLGQLMVANLRNGTDTLHYKSTTLTAAAEFRIAAAFSPQGQHVKSVPCSPAAPANFRDNNAVVDIAFAVTDTGLQNVGVEAIQNVECNGSRGFSVPRLSPSAPLANARCIYFWQNEPKIRRQYQYPPTAGRQSIGASNFRSANRIRQLFSTRIVDRFPKIHFCNHSLRYKA